MIVCGKCGFTQPKDVYCANCGVNLEKYKPEKPPKLVQLLKDPYFQISCSIIIAIAAFFIFINKPSQPVTDDKKFTPEVEVTDNIASTQPSEPETPEVKPEIVKPKSPSFKKQLKALAKGSPAKTKSTPLNEIKNDINNSDEASTSDKQPMTNSGIKKAQYSFYEVLPNQVEKYFTGGSKVEASVVINSELNIQNLSNSRLPMDRDWDLEKSKSNQLDYMVESLEDGELKGIKFSFSHKGLDKGSSKNISIRVNANIPNKEGSASSIDWSRSLSIEKDNVILLKIQLPHNELSASFIEDNYNSPLSIMGSPQFLEQKTQLLAIIRFE